MEGAYTHGHHESVLRSHTWRTAANSAGYLLPHLRPGLDLLDVGCGPGTITLDLAKTLSPGLVVGIDPEPSVIAGAERRRLEAAANNVRFETGNVFGLAMDDATFDVVHAHQVLQHLNDPVRALIEMRRVLRPDGLLAVRDSDYGAFRWSPADPALDRWQELYHQVTAHNRAEADAGRYLLEWVTEAGFEDPVATTSVWTFADPESRRWWGDLWAERIVKSALADQAVEYGLSSANELDEIARAWRKWAASPDAWFVVPHGEIMARRP